MQYFFDTSAIVKLYHQEDGSEIVLPLYMNGKSIIISELSKVEFLSTIHKKFRNNEIDLETVSVISDDNTTFVCADKRLLSLVKNLGHDILEC